MTTKTYLNSYFVLPFYLAALIAIAALTTARAHADNQPGITVLVFGDSLSAAYGLAESDGWVQLLQAELDKLESNVTVFNASISGETTAGGLLRLPAAIERFQPDIVVLELGGNDGLRGQSLKAMRENLSAMTTIAQQASAEVLILGMRIPPNYGPVYTERFYDTFSDVAQEHNAYLVPFFLEPIATSRDFFQRDGIHPTAQAQPLLMQVVADALMTMVSRIMQ